MMGHRDSPVAVSFAIRQKLQGLTRDLRIILKSRLASTIWRFSKNSVRARSCGGGGSMGPRAPRPTQPVLRPGSTTWPWPLLRDRAPNRCNWAWRFSGLGSVGVTS